MAVRERRLSDVLKRGYSDEELGHIYELGRLSLEVGNIRRAEIIFQGMTAVAPEYEPAWLGLSSVFLYEKNYEEALKAARQAMAVNVDSIEAILLLITCLQATGDYTNAGMYLGEVGERLMRSATASPSVARFYRAQLARYQAR